LLFIKTPPNYKRRILYIVCIYFLIKIHNLKKVKICRRIEYKLLKEEYFKMSKNKYRIRKYLKIEEKWYRHVE